MKHPHHLQQQQQELQHKWKKNLYGNRGFPDNYTDQSFLNELKKNFEILDVSYAEAVTGAATVVQEICAITLFVLVFVYLYNEWAEPASVFYSSSGLTFAGFVYYRVCHSSGSGGKTSSVGQDFRTLLIFVIFGQIFSPVLHTLTDTVSTDTIFATTSAMMTVHLVFFDYGVSAAIVSSSLSLSAAMFGSICLASRLASPYHAFVLMTVAVELFALFPILRLKLQFSLSLSMLLVLATFAVLLTVSSGIAVAFVLCLLFINALFPLYFVWCQKHKENISGPWDEAIVNDTDNANQLYCP